MSVLSPVPAELLSEGDFRKDCKADDLIYFLLNVGDGDAQVLLLPEDRTGLRQAVVVDIARSGKVLDLFEALAAGPAPLLVDRPDLIPLLVATHPHEDHVAGIAAFLKREHERIEEVWEPGYYHPAAGFIEMMGEIEDDQKKLRHLQPTSGLVRYIGPVKITALSPGIGLRNRFDSYGIDVNNASIALKIEYPMNRYIERAGARAAVKLPKPLTLILGADSQTLSWAQVQIDFPQLGPDSSAVSNALRKARGVEPLKAHVFKVSHHGSKHGISLELIELIDPSLTLVSSDHEGSRHGFPHRVTLEQIREALHATTSSGDDHDPDWELGLHYTCGSDAKARPLGSIGLVLSKSGRKRNVWRFGDAPGEAVDLAKARRLD